MSTEPKADRPMFASARRIRSVHAVAGLVSMIVDKVEHHIHRPIDDLAFDPGLEAQARLTERAEA